MYRNTSNNNSNTFIIVHTCKGLDILCSIMLLHFCANELKLSDKYNGCQTEFKCNLVLHVLQNN